VTEEARMCDRGYRRIVMSFQDLAQYLRGNAGPYTSELPADVDVLHVIEESRAVQGVAVILGSKEWAPAPMGSLIPALFFTTETFKEAGDAPPRITKLIVWPEKPEVLFDEKGELKP